MAKCSDILANRSPSDTNDAVSNSTSVTLGKTRVYYNMDIQPTVVVTVDGTLFTTNPIVQLNGSLDISGSVIVD